MTTRRELTVGEKREILDRYGMRCFINGHPITDDELEFDHIVPIAIGDNNHSTYRQRRRRQDMFQRWLHCTCLRDDVYADYPFVIVRDFCYP